MTSYNVAELAQTLFEEAGDALFLFAPDTEQMVDVNPMAQRLSGFGRDELLRMQATYLFRAEAQGGLARLRAAFHKTGVFHSQEGFLLRHQKEGVWVPVNLTITRLHAEPRTLGLITARDISERRRIEQALAADIAARRQAEDALRASEAKYRTVVENLDQSIFLKDANLRFVAANPSFCNSLGASEAALVGKTDFEFYPQHLAEKYRADDLIVLAEGRHLSLEEENLLSGRARTVRVVKTPVKDDRGRIMGVLGIFWDVTEQRALEAQLRQAQKMEAIGQLAGGVAHDFNNLLTVILGNVSLLLPRRGAEDPERELLLTAEQAALRAAELTRRLLGFSRRAMLRAEPINLNHCIEETVRILRRTIDPLIRVEVKTRADLWTVKADSAQINQVLMNLCVNARDAMPEGGRLLLETDQFQPDEEYLRLHLDARPGEFVRLRVRDSGYGIPPEIRPRIFEPFFTTKETGKGTGLGLAMVFGIVKQHRGWIDCDSVVHESTTFDIYLPRFARQETGVTVAPAAPRAAPAGKETILLVDDEPMIRQLGTMILERHGYGVLLASDGVEALEVYRQNRGKIDLVILDLTMPRLSGRDTFKRLVELDPAIRVLFSSGYSAEHIPAAEFSQVLGFLNKPYRADELAAKLRATLDRSRGQP